MTDSRAAADHYGCDREDKIAAITACIKSLCLCAALFAHAHFAKTCRVILHVERETLYPRHPCNISPLTDGPIAYQDFLVLRGRLYV
jgi:hypothetical protein